MRAPEQPPLRDKLPSAARLDGIAIGFRFVNTDLRRDASRYHAQGWFLQVARVEAAVRAAEVRVENVTKSLARIGHSETSLVRGIPSTESLVRVREPRFALATA
jgi:hypothetical protein